MAVEAQVQRARLTPVLLGAVLLALVSLAYVGVTWTTEHIPLIVGWLPVPLSALLGWHACLRTAATRRSGRVARRMWRQLAMVCLLVGAGSVSNLYDAVMGAHAPTQRMSPVTAGCFVAAALYLIWSLLRLPTGAEGHFERLLRFWLDAAVLVSGVGLFAWHLVFRAHVLADPTSPYLPLLLIGLVGALGLIKVAMSGFGALDRPAIRLLALAAALGACGGAVTPLLADGRSQINNSMVAVPVSMVIVAFAADRQRRAAGILHPAPPRRTYSVMPYAAVAAVDTLQLWGIRSHSWEAVIVAWTAVGLTALVVLRQVSALRENANLLSRVDANVVDLNRAKAELTHRTHHDDLTNLANRSLFEQESTRILREAAGSGEGLSVVLIDLDDFKSINDRLGHSVGDTVLVGVAQRLRECVRRQDIVARLGGDEFGLLLPGLRGDEAAAVLDRVLTALSRPVHAAGHELLVRASIGLAEAWPGAKPQELLRRADLAMYAAKERGKGRYHVYDAELEQHQAADAQFGAELRLALDREEFFLVYQPIVALPGGSWTGVETLVRWRHPERGLVPPDAFISTAERTGLIVPLGDWILRTACTQAAQWLAAHGTEAPGRVGVNVSARQLREPGFLTDVVEALAAAGLPPERLTVEVTETAVFEGGVALDTLQALADLGVGVALDDFGTGHSSLGLLRTCPAHTLKLDKSFVDGIGGANEETVIASAMIQISDGLHLEAVAEGVETAGQAELLHSLGYRFAQGYHFDRPLTPEQVTQRLAERGEARTAIAA